MGIRSLTLSLAALAMAVPGAVAADPGRHGNHAAGKHVSKGKAAKGQIGKRASTGKRYAGMACPPGRATKSPRCIPPGQWKKGNRIPGSWADQYLPYDRLPEFYRDRYAYDPAYRYLYQDDRVFVIDAATRAIIDIFTR